MQVRFLSEFESRRAYQLCAVGSSLSPSGEMVTFNQTTARGPIVQRNKNKWFLPTRSGVRILVGSPIIMVAESTANREAWVVCDKVSSVRSVENDFGRRPLFKCGVPLCPMKDGGTV
jgi:hypothetical protein